MCLQSYYYQFCIEFIQFYSFIAIVEFLHLTGYPRHRENRENGQKNPCQGKHREFWKFCQNTGKTQGILLAQVVKVLILKVKDIAIVAPKKNPFFSRSWIGLPSQFCVCNTHKLCKLAQGKFAVRQGKQGIRKYNLSGYPGLVPVNVFVMNVTSAVSRCREFQVASDRLFGII